MIEQISKTHSTQFIPMFLLNHNIHNMWCKIFLSNGTLFNSILPIVFTMSVHVCSRWGFFEKRATDLSWKATQNIKFLRAFYVCVSGNNRLVFLKKLESFGNENCGSFAVECRMRGNGTSFSYCLFGLIGLFFSGKNSEILERWKT